MNHAKYYLEINVHYFFYEIKLNDKVKKVFFTILNDFTSYI